tara:strand:+ start:881 stop:1192 length:312 start_codon:yes stop_codon:yes gene_type:complete
MKKGPLSNEEKKHIEKNLDTEIADLAESMDRSFKLVKAYVDKVSTQPEPKPKQDSKTMQLLARNEDRGVVVMTESASSHFDENRKRAEPPRRYTSIIHKIKEE